MKVLIGVDGSADSLEAVRQAAELMDPNKDSVAFYYSPIGIRLPAGRAGQEEVVQDAREAMARVVFEHAKSDLPVEFHAGLETIEGTRPPKQGLIAAADDIQADMIVVGARGASRLERLMLGSVSRAVVHNSRLPVLIARKRPASHENFNVLWAYDAEGTDKTISRFLNLLHWPARTRAEIMTVVPSLYAGEIPAWLENKSVDTEIRAWGDQWSRTHESEKQRTREALHALCTHLPAVFSNADCHLAEGHVVDQILQRITEEDVDLVILGAHAGGAISRLLLGSTSDAVLGNAPCSVLIVREKDRP